MGGNRADDRHACDPGPHHPHAQRTRRSFVLVPETGLHGHADPRPRYRVGRAGSADLPGLDLLFWGPIVQADTAGNTGAVDCNAAGVDWYMNRRAIDGARTNLLTNPNFEDDLDGWTVNAMPGFTVAASTTRKVSATHSLAMFNGTPDAERSSARRSSIRPPPSATCSPCPPGTSMKRSSRPTDRLPPWRLHRIGHRRTASCDYDHDPGR